MLRKIIKVRNVGRLRKVDAAGDVEFRRLTLIFSENARGKTTLCDIFRSIKTGIGDYIVGRRTLASAGAPEVQLLFDNGTATFTSGAWDIVHPEFEIFDSTFVHENVYAGEYVDHEHKRNLYRVVIGDEGVRLARRVDELDGAMRESDRRLAEAREKVGRFAPQSMSLDEFLNLLQDERVDERIRQAQDNINALNRLAEVQAAAELGPLSLPEIPTEFAGLMSRRLEDLVEGAEHLVRTHLRERTAGATEKWASDGFGYVRDESCPFCGQSLEGLDLIQAYRGYFSEQYRSLRNEVGLLQSRVEALAGDAPGLRLDQAITRNESLSDFWLQFVNFDRPQISLNSLREVLKELVSVTLEVVNRKSMALSDAIDLGPEFLRAQARFEAAKLDVARYNEAVAAANALIREKKTQTAVTDLRDAGAVLGRARAGKSRHQGDGKRACDQYEELVREKGQRQGEKNEAKRQLDEHSEQILSQFENRINQLLEQFGASFRIGGVTRQYLGGRPSSTYEVVINGVGVDLGDSETSLGIASFRNTLSAGDRSTLAFAFFLARVELDPRIADRILVFDDPFSSQDRSRRTCTQQQICRLAQRSKEVMVLSHEPMFLRSVWDAVDRGTVRTLQVSRVGEDNSTITQWDIEDDTRGEYFKTVQVLREFVDYGQGDPRHVAQTMRPVLEGHLRFNYPGMFGANEWLGDFLQKIRESQPGQSIYALMDILAELEDLNDFSKRYHHTENSAAATEPIDSGELSSFVKRTLRLTAGY